MANVTQLLQLFGLPTPLLFNFQRLKFAQSSFIAFVADPDSCVSVSECF